MEAAAEREEVDEREEVAAGYRASARARQDPPQLFSEDVFK